MAANFTDNWYVLKSRLCLFAPLRDNFEFLIDKSEAGGAALNAPRDGASLAEEINTRFNTVWDNNKNDNAAGETPLDYRGSQIKALTFGEGNKKPGNEYNRRYLFNNSANTEMNRMMMTPHRTATVNFWVRCIDSTRFKISDPYSYPVNNFAVSSSIEDGVVIGVDFATVNYGGFRDKGYPSGDLDKYVLMLQNRQYTSDNPNVPSLLAADSTQGLTGSYTTPAGSGLSSEKGNGVWFMVTHVLSFGSNSDEGIAIETHVRYKNENDDYVHLVWKQIGMNGVLWEGDGATGVWGIGLPGDYDPATSDDNKIAIRNLMIYESRLDASQQRMIFDNGIDPFQADLESTYDFDQHDRNYWGSYGILGTRSNLRIEKSIFTTGGVVITDPDTGSGEIEKDGETHGLPFRQWADSDTDEKGPTIESSRREHIALRDNSALVMIGEQRPDGDGITEKDGTQNFYSTKWKDFAIDLLGSFDGNISREPYSTEVTNRYIFPVKNKEGKYINYFTNRPSIISWRNSRVAGTRSTDPYRIWLSEGSTFNGFSDAILISDMAHPEDLPSGTYVASLTYNPKDVDYLDANPDISSAATTAKGYPKHIGLLKFQYEAGQINYSNSFTYNGNGGKTLQTSSPIFWERQPRFIIMEWDAAAQSGANYGGPVQFDALAWKPIAWHYVVYEIQEASKLSDRENLNAGNYQGKILMHLFGDPITSGNNNPVVFETSRYRYKATYEKPYIRVYNGDTQERDYGGWNFVSFEPDNSIEDDGASNTSKQFANRIYLPRVTIPHIKIPVLRPKLTVVKKPQSETFTDAIDGVSVGEGWTNVEKTSIMQRKLFVTSGIAFYKGGDDGWNRSASYCGLDGEVYRYKNTGPILIYHDGGNKSDLKESGQKFCPLSSGWYRVFYGARNYVVDQGGSCIRSYIRTKVYDAKNSKYIWKDLQSVYLNAGTRSGDSVNTQIRVSVATSKLVWLNAPDLSTPKETWPQYEFGFENLTFASASDVVCIVELVSASQADFSQIVSKVNFEFDVAPSTAEEGVSGGETAQRFNKYVTSEPSPVDPKVNEQWIHLFNVEALYSRFNKNNANGAKLVTSAAESAEPTITNATDVSDFWVTPSPYQEDGAASNTTRTRSY